MKAVQEWENYNNNSAERIIVLREGITEFQSRFIERKEIT